MGAFYIGPLTIQYQWLVILIACFVTYIVIEQSTKQDKLFQKSFIDVVGTASMVLVLTYKFSILIFRPTLLFSNPIAIIYFTGGQKGLIIGFLAFIGIIAWKTFQQNWDVTKIIKLFISLVSAFFITYYIVKLLFLQIL